MVRLTAWVVALAASAAWLWSGVGAWPVTPEAQVISIVRAVAASLATWLLVVTVLAVAARLLRIRWLGAVAPAGVRRLVASALAGAVLLSPGVAAASAGGGASAPPPGVEVPVLDRVESAAATATTTGAATPATVTPPSLEAPEVHLVEPGDSLWHIAAGELAVRLGHEPSDAEVIPYWRRLIDANRHVVGENPDLIRPGQQIDLPS
jgi:nucleoid-associated protein YgaU